MASSRSVTLLKVPRRMRLVVISAKNRSTRLSQEALVGVKWQEKRGSSEPRLHLRRFVRRIVVEHQMYLEVLLHDAVDLAQKAQELLRPMARLDVADDETRPDVERREQCRGAVALIVVRHPGSSPGPPRGLA